MHAPLSRAGASRYEERLAIIYAAPLPFRHCFLQRKSPSLADYAANLRNFPWLPVGLTCREATGFFDWEAHTQRLSSLAVCAEWQVMSLRTSAASSSSDAQTSQRRACGIGCCKLPRPQKRRGHASVARAATCWRWATAQSVLEPYASSPECLRRRATARAASPAAVQGHPAWP